MSLTTQKQKMAQLRLATVMKSLHTKALDVALPDDERLTASAELAMAMMKHFDLIENALRGGK